MVPPRAVSGDCRVTFSAKRNSHPLNSVFAPAEARRDRVHARRNHIECPLRSKLMQAADAVRGDRG